MADGLEGPYVHHRDPVVNNPTYIEDPYAFIYDGVFYMVINDNHGPDGPAAMLVSSEDGLFYDYYQGVRFGRIADYIPPEQMPPDPPKGFFERPQLLLKDGAPTHLFCPGGRVNSGGTRCYLFELRQEQGI